jgi:predicted kinase
VIECVILAGLPGAGKSTFYHTFFAATHVHLSKDLWPNARNRDARLREELDRVLAEGRSVVIDNVNASAADRAPLIDIARTHAAAVVGYFFAVTTRQAVARNATRTGRGKVPNVAIFAAAKKYQEPRLDEGFDQLFRIELTDDRQSGVHEVAE